jgi:hypothetical protein
MADEFVFPVAAIRHNLIALGKTRAGKSSKLRVLAEYLLEGGSPVCIIDPKGDWWGLKSSADGKRAGFPIVIFGGEHADVPINEHSGAHVAEIIATGNRPALIDLGGWMVGQRTRFFVDFAGTFFKLARGARHLVIDEVHNFAPQGRIMDPDAGKMLHWANRLASEGSGKGITLYAASQRPQKVHKDFVTSCETLIACKVIHKLDRDAIKDWIDGCADATKGREVIADLAQLKKPEAWVWCPEVDFGPKRVEFPMFRTYDSFKPQAADIGKLKGWAEVDLEEVKAKLVAVVKEAEANDPRKLKAEIARLQKLTSSASNEAPKTNTAALDARVATLEQDNAALERHRDELARALQQAQRQLIAARGNLITFAEQLAPDAAPQYVAPPRAARAEPRRVPVPPKPRTNGHATSLKKAEHAFLRALWWLRDEERTPEKVAFYAGYSVTSSSFGNSLGALRSAGLVQAMGVTYEGEKIIASVAGEKPTGRELREWVRPKLNKAENAFLDALIAANGDRLDDDTLCERAGYSITSSSFGNSVGRLRSIGAAQGYAKDGGTKASDVFYAGG